MTQQVNGTEQEGKVLSAKDDFDAEWEDEDATSDASTEDKETGADGADTTGQEKAADDETVSDSAVSDGTTEDSPKSSNDSSAESASEDIWANATEAQKTAFLNAQNGINAMKGRAKTAAQIQKDLETELKKATAGLAEATRVKGDYEKQHPELFAELRDSFASPASETTETASDETVDEVPDDIKVVFKAHPDANTVMATPEWTEFQNNLSVEDTLKFNSDNPADFISLMTGFKANEIIRKSKAKDTTSADLLEAAAGGGGGSSSTPSQTKTNPSTKESFDAEWDKD